MDTVSQSLTLDDLRAVVARIEEAPTFDFEASLAPMPQPAPIQAELPPVVSQFDDVVPVDREPFGRWLVAQAARKKSGWVADLAKWAKGDPRAPAAATPDDVRKRLTEIYAEGDAFEALDDAELDWLAL